MKLTFSTAPGRLSNGSRRDMPGPQGIKRHFSKFGAVLMTAALMLPFGCVKKAVKEPERKAEIRVIYLSKHLSSLIEDMKSGRPRHCGKWAYERHLERRVDQGDGTVSYNLLAQATDLLVEKSRLSDTIAYDLETFGRTFRAAITFRSDAGGVLSPATLSYLTYRDSGYHQVPGTCYLERDLDTQLIQLDTFNAILSRATGERPRGVMWVLDHDARAGCDRTCAFAIPLADSAVGQKPEGAAGRGDSIPFKVLGGYKGGHLACGWGADGPRWDAVVFLVEPGDTFPDLSGLGVKTVSYH